MKGSREKPSSASVLEYVCHWIAVGIMKQQALPHPGDKLRTHRQTVKLEPAQQQRCVEPPDMSPANLWNLFGVAQLQSAVLCVEPVQQQRCVEHLQGNLCGHRESLWPWGTSVGMRTICGGWGISVGMGNLCEDGGSPWGWRISFRMGKLCGHGESLGGWEHLCGDAQLQSAVLLRVDPNWTGKPISCFHLAVV